MGIGLQQPGIATLRETFGSRLQENVPLGRYTAARLGGPAQAFLEVNTLPELEQAVGLAWINHWPLLILGGGSNLLVSDRGVPGLVVLNRARGLRLLTTGSRPMEDETLEAEERPQIWAESGANFGLLARLAAQHGLSGLEWAAGIPGTLGGAVIGNAGAHGSDMAGNLIVAEILHRGETEALPRREEWSVQQMAYGYRTSILKRTPGQAVVLAARLRLQAAEPESVQARTEELTAYRKRTQPPGASMGSMFKNPPGDYAGRLIEAAGLKGAQVGDARISEVHANFFINGGDARAEDLRKLIDLARETVAQKFGVDLELEIELVGEW